ncbi:threonine operon leader peptide (artificial fragment), partial [Salmonella enterica subsp. enterica serovar Enteritidis str. P125109]
GNGAGMNRISTTTITTITIT